MAGRFDGAEVLRRIGRDMEYVPGADIRPDVAGADIAPVAALLGDRARAAMLTALLDGRPLAAGELARTAGVSAATASAHLRQAARRRPRDGRAGRAATGTTG